MVRPRRLVLVAAALLAGGCATGLRPRAERVPGSAAERLTSLSESNPDLHAETLEERFGAEEDHERRAAERAARAERQRRVEAVEAARKRLQN